MRQGFDKRIPRYGDLIQPIFRALQALGGSGSNAEVLNHVIENLNLPDAVVDYPHKGSTSITELSYQCAWARTYLKKFGVIENSSRSVWSITPKYAKVIEIDPKHVIKEVSRMTRDSSESDLENGDPEDDGVSMPEEAKPWRTRLLEILARNF